MKVDFNQYPPQKFVSEFRQFLWDKKPPNFKVTLKWELVPDEDDHEEELQQGTALGLKTAQETYLSQPFMHGNIHMGIVTLHASPCSVVAVPVLTACVLPALLPCHLSI